ncbi:hypothetical protein [Streptomyces sp. A1136]|uniref:hypothetical protein n=1 Tax=Streptomyces sp. A1136 TaxID=2563102 RepID=UPI0014450E40|nr:hypothetical protein [Streptomyces sp. A1136]
MVTYASRQCCTACACRQSAASNLAEDIVPRDCLNDPVPGSAIHRQALRSLLGRLIQVAEQARYKAWFAHDPSTASWAS